MKIAYAFNSTTGEFFAIDPAGDFVKIADGYSGSGAGRNNPALESKRGIGPIPRGCYAIGQPHFSQKVGPVAMFLQPMGHNAHGRSAFMFHGDNSTRTASTGCVILPREVRQQIANEQRMAAVRDELVGLEVI